LNPLAGEDAHNLMLCLAQQSKRMALEKVAPFFARCSAGERLDFFIPYLPDLADPFPEADFVKRWAAAVRIAEAAGAAHGLAEYVRDGPDRTRRSLAVHLGWHPRRFLEFSLPLLARLGVLEWIGPELMRLVAVQLMRPPRELRLRKDVGTICHVLGRSGWLTRAMMRAFVREQLEEDGKVYPELFEYLADFDTFANAASATAALEGVVEETHELWSEGSAEAPAYLRAFCDVVDMKLIVPSVLERLISEAPPLADVLRPFLLRAEVVGAKRVRDKEEKAGAGVTSGAKRSRFDASDEKEAEEDDYVPPSRDVSAALFTGAGAGAAGAAMDEADDEAQVLRNIESMKGDAEVLFQVVADELTVHLHGRPDSKSEAEFLARAMNAALDGLAREQPWRVWMAAHPEVREGASAYEVDRWFVPLLRSWYESTYAKHWV
jgi:hypothetical protein